jgi:hypothetical protein
MIIWVLTDGSQNEEGDQGSLLQAVSDILVGIEKVTLESVFHNWMKRLCQSSATGGEYVE